MALRGMIGGLCAIVVLSGACARDREFEPETPPQPQATQGNPPRLPRQRQPRNPSTAQSQQPQWPAPSQQPTATAPRPISSATANELFRAQDACLTSCDQFACMKIANAYKNGVVLPADVLAGRRYAIHACLECGKPGLAIADECPSFGLKPVDK